MKDNPLHAEEKSSRRKIVDIFEINLGRCILCGICVDVCNFDAIEMSQEHELSKFERNANRADLKTLLVMGKTWQSQTSWTPTKTKNIGDPDIRARQQADDKAAKADKESDKSKGDKESDKSKGGDSAKDSSEKSKDSKPAPKESSGDD